MPNDKIRALPYSRAYGLDSRRANLPHGGWGLVPAAAGWQSVVVPGRERASTYLLLLLITLLLTETSHRTVPAVAKRVANLSAVQQPQTGTD